ncbi:hypothetical protein [Streptomyces peucetius]|uniref:hypothetical protein n=1 Tax=Streptomyces peucetius TaxID=1950 RepID=UPI0039B067CF
MSADSAREDTAREDGAHPASPAFEPRGSGRSPDEGSAREGAPEESVLRGTAAGDTTPVDAARDDGAPDGAAPEETARDDSAPEGTASDDDAPEGATRRPGALAALRRIGGRTAAAARRGRALPAALAVATVAVTALSGWLCVEVYEQRAEAERHQDILAAARQSALNFTSLDYRHYDRDSKNVLKGATGEFKEQFSAQTEELTKLVAANKSVSEGQVLEAGIARSDERSARVLVVADSKVTNTAAPEGQARTYRLQLDLVLERGRWLTSNVEFVG